MVVTVIAAHDVSKEYTRGKEIVRALKNIELEIKEGEFIAIVGSSGCGKTTLLNILSGLDVPTSGRAFLDGQDTSTLNESSFPKVRLEKVGFIFQDFNLIEDMTVIENVEAPLYPTKLKNKKIREKALNLLRLVDLVDRKDHLPKQLSGGEQQRVSIARALVNDTKVVFADEPTGNLDSTTGTEILELLKKLNKEQNTTIMLVTHDMKNAEYAKRRIKLEDGKVVA